MLGTLSDFVERNANTWARQHDAGEWSVTLAIVGVDLALLALMIAAVHMSGKMAQRGRMSKIAGVFGAAVALLAVAFIGGVVAWMSILAWDKVASNGISIRSFTNIAFRVVFIASVFPPVAAIAILATGLRVALGKKS